MANRLVQQAVWWLTGWFSRLCGGKQVGSAGSVVANRLVQSSGQFYWPNFVKGGCRLCIRYANFIIFRFIFLSNNKFYRHDILHMRR